MVQLSHSPTRSHYVIVVAVDKPTIHVVFVFQRKEGPQNGQVDDRADQFWPEEGQATKPLERGSRPAQLPNEGDD